MAEGEILELIDFFRKTTVTEYDHRAYHDRGWLTGNLVSFIPEVDVHTVEGSTILCFESQLAAGIGPHPSRFLSSIMNYLGCSLVYLNVNVVSAFSSFVILCECWLGIPSNTSLFWYYYSPARYTKTIFSGIDFSLWRKRNDEYIKATFKGCWKGAQQKWILMDIHDQPSWVNKLLFPPAIKNKRSEPPMTDRLAALTKRVAELRQAGLEAYHYVEEFYLRRICPLGHQKKMAFECSRMADPYREPSEGCLFVLSPYYWQQPYIDLTYLLCDAALSLKEINEFVAHLFDKGVPTACPNSVPMPFSSDNPPNLVRILDFFKFVSDLWSYESILIIYQNLYPAHPVDVEVSDSNHDGQDDPTGNDDGGQGASSAEPIVSDLIGSGTAAQVRPFVADHLTTIAPLGSGPPKKKRLMLASKRKQYVPSDQVTTELFPHHAPRCSLGLVAVKLVFGCLFEALQRIT
jgi:hypothetical protein